MYKSIFVDKLNIYVNKKYFFAHIVPKAMEFKYDFLQNQKPSWLYLILGILWVLSSLYYDLLQDERVSKFIFYLIIGLIIISRGLGVPIEKLFGKKYIYLSDDELNIKLSILKKGIKIDWKEIASLQLWPGKIKITTQNAGIHDVEITEIDAQIRHDFLETIIRISDKKRIDTKKHGYLSNIH